jgi:hypothetical protein
VIGRNACGGGGGSGDSNVTDQSRMLEGIMLMRFGVLIIVVSWHLQHTLRSGYAIAL